MTTFESVMFLLGVFLAAVIFLLILIPICVGSVEWWMNWWQRMRAIRAQRKLRRDEERKHQPD